MNAQAISISVLRSCFLSMFQFLSVLCGPCNTNQKAALPQAARAALLPLSAGRRIVAVGVQLGAAQTLDLQAAGDIILVAVVIADRDCAFASVTCASSVSAAAQAVLKALAFLPASATASEYEDDHMWMNNGADERAFFSGGSWGTGANAGLFALIGGNPRSYSVDRKSTRLNSSHLNESRMPSSA